MNLIIPGEPIPAARHRTRRTPTGIATYKTPANRLHEQAIWQAWHEAGRPRFDGRPPLTLSVHFFLLRPKAHHRANGQLRRDAPARPMGRRNDLDNLLKLLLDGLSGHAWEDDSQVVCFTRVSKQYAAPGTEPRTELEAWPAANPRLLAEEDAAVTDALQEVA